MEGIDKKKGNVSEERDKIAGSGGGWGRGLRGGCEREKEERIRRIKKGKEGREGKRKKRREAEGKERRERWGERGTSRRAREGASKRNKTGKGGGNDGNKTKGGQGKHGDRTGIDGWGRSWGWTISVGVSSSPLGIFSKRRQLSSIKSLATVWTKMIEEEKTI